MNGVTETQSQFQKQLLPLEILRFYIIFVNSVSCGPTGGLPVDLCLYSLNSFWNAKDHSAECLWFQVIKMILFDIAKFSENMCLIQQVLSIYVTSI